MKRLLCTTLLLLTACASTHPDQVAEVKASRDDVVMYAMSLVDTPYQYGGKGRSSGFDCSGFVGHVYRETAGLSLPRTAREISRVGRSIHMNELRPGDLVFYNTQHKSFSHVGIYIGEGKFVHSPKTGDSVRVELMKYNYWTKRYNGARRLIR